MSAVFRAIADPTRRAILDRLRDGPANANAIAAGFCASRPGVSRHLRVLREAGLVADTPLGRERVYRMNPAPLEEAAIWIESHRAFWRSSLATLKHRLENEP